MPQQSQGSNKDSRDSSELSELVDTLVKNLSLKDISEGDDPSGLRLVQAVLDAATESGFEIRATTPSSPGSTADRQNFTQQLTGRGQLRLRELMSIWREVSARESPGPADFYVQVGQRILKAGQPLIAYDILDSGLHHWPTDLRLRQLRALALARSGASSRARMLLRELVSEGHEDEETLGLLARTNKDLWESSDHAEDRIQLLKEAHQLYRKGYDWAVASGSLDGALYAGINAATTALLLGDRETSQQIGREVAEICQRKLANESDYWALATLGECALIAGRLDEAETHYSRAAHWAGRNFADIASTKRNASLLLRFLGEQSVELDAWFPVPSIVVFAGHLIDQPGAPIRFPAGQIDQVYDEIKRVLRETGAGFGFSAAACGGDLLFLEALQELGGESHVVLPLPHDEFISASVAVPGGKRDWEADFSRLLAEAAKVTVVNEFSRQARPEHFEYANHVMTGLAMLQSRSLGTKVVPVALWDEGPARGLGGTGTLVEFWKNLGWEPRVINPLRLSGSPIVVPDSEGRPNSKGMAFTSPLEMDIEIRAMLFADVVGYSKLNEEEIPLFVRDFMGSISDCVRQSDVSIETYNTWGDAIYFVFRDVADAGVTALRITEHVNSIDWQKRGFKSVMTLRIGLHVGPVYRVVDPVTLTEMHTGAHVSRTARIEPIAPPGEVYASEAFAAVSEADNVSQFQCDYIGVTPMAKGYGEFATYHVRRRSG